MSVHHLISVGQEYICTKCRRRWDFDEAPDDDEECDADTHPCEEEK